MILHCTDCNHESDHVDLQIIEYEGELKKLCDNCLDSYVSCEHCGKWVQTDNGEAHWSDIKEGFYCEACKDSELIFCDDCGAEISLHNRYLNADGNSICETCINDYSSCDNCGDIIHTDNTCSNNNRYYCESCYSDIDDDDVDLNEYDGHVLDARDDVQWDMYKESYENTVYMGVEIEMEFKEGGNSSSVVKACNESIKNRYVLKHDGSLDNGIELVITPHTLKKWHTLNMYKLLNNLKDQGIRSHDTDTCGLHVHVNRDSLTCNAIQKLWRFIIANKNNITELSRRYSSQWARIPDEYNSNERERYMAINLQNDNTIEFRCFKGTLNANTFKATLQLVDSLINFVNDHSMQIFKGSKSWKTYLGYIKKANRYNHLIKYMIKRGVINE